MSETWKYVAEQPGEITEIYTNGRFQQTIYPGLRMYSWYVRLATGEVRGIFSLSPTDFSGADKRALEEGQANARALEQKWRTTNRKIVEEVNLQSSFLCC